MVYDDDTGATIHHPIFSDDQASAVPDAMPIPPEIHRLIAELARRHRNWDADRILAELRRRRVEGVSLEMVKYVLDGARRAGRRG